MKKPAEGRVWGLGRGLHRIRMVPEQVISVAPHVACHMEERDHHFERQGVKATVISRRCS